MGGLVVMLLTAGVAAYRAPVNLNNAELTRGSLVWSDEFNGPAGTRPDPRSWNFETGGVGASNHELQCYTTSAANSAENGQGEMVITALNERGHVCDNGKTYNYTSARLTTKEKITTQYGRLAIRAQVPTAPGTWPAFWALGSNITKVGWPAAGEIDAMEVIGSAPSVIHGTVHGANRNGAAYSVQQTYDVKENLNNAFHIFAVDWTPTQIQFSLDGHVYGVTTKSAVSKAGNWAFDQPFYLLINLAIGGDWPGSPTAKTTWPQRYIIDWVRVYG